LVERFLPGEADAPAQIGGFRGRRVTEGEQREIDAAIEAVCGASIDEQQIELEVNDGDVVWDGTRAVVVAIS
jgi:outer membrane lipoprotein SlyB